MGGAVDSIMNVVGSIADPIMNTVGGGVTSAVDSGMSVVDKGMGAVSSGMDTVTTPVANAVGGIADPVMDAFGKVADPTIGKAMNTIGNATGKVIEAALPIAVVVGANALSGGTIGMAQAAEQAAQGNWGPAAMQAISYEANLPSDGNTFYTPPSGNWNVGTDLAGAPVTTYANPELHTVNTVYNDYKTASGVANMADKLLSGTPEKPLQRRPGLVPAAPLRQLQTSNAALVGGRPSWAAGNMQLVHGAAPNLQRAIPHLAAGGLVQFSKSRRS